MTWPASEYRSAAEGLDAHMACCPSCSAGTACAVGDETAEAEFRTWREWERVDQAATRQHRRNGFTW